LGRLFDLRARADYELGETLLTLEAIDEHLDEVERLLGRCADIVERAASRGPDEPDPPADR
jgi:hypothetical protein